MKVLLVTNPAIGHVYPMLPVAQVLQDAGHEVAFATSQVMGPSIAAKGFRTFAAGMDWMTYDAGKLFPEFLQLTAAEQGEFYITEVFSDIAAHPMVADLLTIMEEWRPDIILRNDFEFGSCVAAECLGIPHATISISFFFPPTVLGQIIGDQLAFLRSAYGLRPYPSVDMLYPSLYLSFAPPSFQPPQIAVMQSLRPLIFDRFGDDGLPDWFASLPDQPIVYASMSSIYKVADIFPIIIEALRDEPVTLIITVGREQDPAIYGSLPPNVRIERFIPQALLFPHCDVFITHNPFATMMSSLSHGVPMLLVPIAGELLGGAHHAAQMDLGIVLRRPELDPSAFHPAVAELNPDTVRAAIREILADSKYRESARRMQREMQALGGPERLLELVSQVVAGKPITGQ